MQSLDQSLNTVLTSLEQARQPHMQPHGSTSSGGQSITILSPEMPAVSEGVIRNLPAEIGTMHGVELLKEIVNLSCNWENVSYMADKPSPPVLQAGSKIHALAIDVLNNFERRMAPANSEAKAVILRKLQGHYYQPGMSEALMREVASDYLRLLDGYPVDLMQEAADKFVLDPEQRFFPKVGELKTKMDHLLFIRKRHISRLKTLIETAK